jgi:hypothetical protein
LSPEGPEWILALPGLRLPEDHADTQHRVLCIHDEHTVYQIVPDQELECGAMAHESAPLTEPCGSRSSEPLAPLAFALQLLGPLLLVATVPAPRHVTPEPFQGTHDLTIALRSPGEQQTGNITDSNAARYRPVLSGWSDPNEPNPLARALEGAL